ncbi:amino acid adenylation domain-containing protein [Nitratidesulfovibrio sp. 1201_IL3209]|uniref:amino acid adenylation domain-containing protein n=1 Tax=Nitratidesulfovibrio sp. 1201_IL3209 TaxID=3084053 RepID=UPI002FDB66CC
MYSLNTSSSDLLAGTLVDVLERTAARFPARGVRHVDPAGSEEEFQSYADLLLAGRRTAQALYRRGLRPRDHLIIVVESSRQFLELFWGCLFAGVTPVPLANVRTPRPDSMEAVKIATVQRLLGAPVVADGEGERGFAMLAEVLKESGAALLPAGDLLAEAAITGQSAAEFHVPAPGDIAVLQFSSGSMGAPKGARLTHRNLLANIVALRNLEGVDEDDRMVTWLPYFHDFGLFGCHLMPLYAGIDQVKMSPFQFAQRPFLWMQKIHEHRATVTSTTNTGVEHLLSYMGLRGARLPEVDLSCLRVLTVGAEMISAAACRRLERQLAPMGLARNIIMPGYGLTETTLVATCHPNGLPVEAYLVDRRCLVNEGIVRYASEKTDTTAEFVSVGTPVDFCEVRVVDAEGRELPPDRVGTVEIRGENVIASYHEAPNAGPDANREAFRNGWFSSGDAGFMTATGQLCIVGREKEIIIVRGQNYYPTDIEMMALEGAGDTFRLVVACGAYDPAQAREKVVMFFVPADRKADERALAPALLAMNERIGDLAGFTIDHFVPVTQGEIPRTSSGKIMRRVLADDFVSGGYAERTARIDAALTELARPANPSDLDHDAVVREAWSAVLGMEPGRIDPHRSLFKMGGDSIRAMRIQARLEDTYQAKMESNFCYLFPTVATQTAYFRNRDFSVEPPRNEIEAILQKIVAGRLGVRTDTVGATESLLTRITNVSDMLGIIEDVKHCFEEVRVSEEFLKFTTIRQMADHLWPRVFEPQADESGSDGERFLPLMHFQETLYFHRKGFVRNEPSGLSCYIFLQAEMTGEFDRATFDGALNYVVSRHPVLRTVIDEERERPRMKVLDTVPRLRTAYVDISDMTEERQRAYVTQRGLEHNDHRFDLGAWPLFFCEVTRLGRNRHMFMMNIDHLLVDGYSYMQIFEELFNTYDRMRLGEPWELPEVPMTFGDYVLVERLRQRTREYRDALEFQLDIFRNLPPKAMLPSRRNPAMLDTVRFDTLYQTIEPEIINALNQVAIEHQVSLNSVLLAAYFKLMNIWCHQDDLIINMPVFNREQYFAGARKTVGSFIDIFPVRLQTHFEEPVIDIARKAEAFTRKLLEVPVSSIELSRRIFEREGLRATSMSSIIFSNSIGMYSGEVSGMKTVRLSTPEFRTGAPGTFIDLVIYDYRARQDEEDAYYFNWNYVRDLFDRDFVEILSTQYRTLLRQLADAHSSGHADAPFTGENVIPEKYRALLDEVNRTEAPIPDDTLHGLIARTVARTPDALALTFEDASLTYAEFDDRAARVAGLLASLGVGSGDFVALFMHRSIEVPVAQLGVMKAGAAYLPIDIDYPADRVAYVLADSRTRVLLTQSRHLAGLEAHLGGVGAVVLLDEGASEADVPAALRGKVVLPEAAYAPRTAPLPACAPRDLAYMIYTSGSTGNPKGVMVTHRNIVNFLNWVHLEIGIAPEDRLALLTSYAFDMTLTSNWTPFLAGASLHILSEERTRDVNSLLHFLGERDITFLNVTPSHFSLLAGAREYLGDQPIPLRDGMRIMMGGEIINTKDLNLWLRHYPGHRFINEYGPTETTVASTWFPIPVNDEGRVDLNTVPIGKPVFNTRVYILNRDLKACMLGVPGELCIGGEGVTNGYHDKPDKDAAAFVPDPYRPGERIYRTGDVVRMLNDGNIEYLGRNDHQINLRGYRIEAGEIEFALRGHDGVAEAVVAPRRDTSGSLVLVAFYTGPTDSIGSTGPVPVADLRAHLARNLPEYMIPVHFEHLPEMPCTPSGKLDRKGLPEVTIQAGRIDDASDRPTTPLEQQVTRIWEEVLGVSGIGLSSNFWDVGGDSLKAMRLIMRMKKEGFIDFGLREAFEYQTVASIVEHIRRRASPGGEEADMVELTAPQFPLARLFCLPYACGNPTMYREFAAHLPRDYGVLAASLPGHGRSGSPLGSIPEIAQTYAGRLSDLARETPLFLLGYSFGGHVAYEIARLLEERGTPSAGVVIVSSPPPGVQGGLRAILSGSDEDILRHSREVYKYDFSHMTDAERDDYLKTLRIDTAAMLDFTFGPQLRTPALVVAGQDEEDAPIRSLAAQWERAFVTCLQCNAGGAHMLIKTHASELAARTAEFIDGLAIGAEARD